MTRRLAVLVLLLGLAAFTLGPVPASGSTLSGDLLSPDDGGSLEVGGVECKLIEVPVAAPVGTGPCPGVRPGALVETPVGFCSFNFLFHGSDGGRYMGTAGHCVLEDDDERTWATGSGPIAQDADGNRVGEFAYAVLGGEKDFALIRLDAGVAASPQMCHFGGPTHLNGANPTETVVLNHYGQGVGVSAVLPARSALAFGMPDDDHVFAEGAVAPGDSGSGIQSDDGGAVGVIVTVGVHLASIGTSGVDAGTVGVTRLGPQLARASDQLGPSFELQTAALL